MFAAFLCVLGGSFPRPLRSKLFSRPGCPTLPALFAGGWGFSRPRLAHFSRPLRELGLTKIVILSEAKDLLFLVTPSEA